MSDAHQSLDIEHVRRDLHVLHEHVIRNWGRIHVTREGDNEPANACVIISKAELDCIERALEMFHDSPGGRAMAEEISRVIEQCAPRGAAAVANALTSLIERNGLTT